MKRKHIIRACLLLFCLLLCTACRSESKPKETRFSFVSEDSLTIVNAEGQELHFADKVWSGTMPVLDGHFTVDFVPGSTSVQVRFSESFSLSGLNRSGRKDRSICLLRRRRFPRRGGPRPSERGIHPLHRRGDRRKNMQYEVGISTGTRTYLEVTGSGESRVRYERDGKKGIFHRAGCPVYRRAPGPGPAGSRWIPWNSPQGRPARSAFATASRHLRARSGDAPQGCHCPPFK